MLGCEIIEAADAGEIIYWSESYTARVLVAHGLSLDEYLNEILREAHKQGPQRYNAAYVLLWLGY